MKLTLTTVVIAALIIFNACKDIGHNNGFSYGIHENGKYINKFLGFTIDIPDECYVYSKEEIGEIMGLLEDNENFTAEAKENLKKNKVRSADLFMAQRYDPAEFEKLVNPTFMINVERVDDIELIRNSSDYMKLARKNMKMMSNAPVEFENVASVKLGENLYERHTINKNAAGYDYETTQFCKIMKGYAVIFTLTYRGEHDRKALVRCLSSLEIKE